jgi:hypothetical protein
MSEVKDDVSGNIATRISANNFRRTFENSEEGICQNAVSSAV